MESPYCNNLLRYQRQETQVVDIGGIPLGGNFPIRIQTMTNTPTSNIKETVSQIERIQKAGAEYVRITVPAKRDVENLKKICEELDRRGINLPLIADIHFNPDLALSSAAIVSKVRINPGNYVDRKQFKTRNYSDEEYQNELIRLREQFTEFLKVCREHGTAIRIGTNHGSLSDRIMSRFGDTPEGMAESAMEFLRICREEDFRDVVVSMKASNTRVMVYATRLLRSKMHQEGMNYPLHLGVTEAGEGEDGRIRSAVGIGTLLADGIGETIRVSLTEEPEAEIPVAENIVQYVASWEGHSPVPKFGILPIDPFRYQKRPTLRAGILGGEGFPVVISKIKGEVNFDKLAEIGWKYGKKPAVAKASAGKSNWNIEDISPDLIFADQWDPAIPVPEGRYILMPATVWAETKRADHFIPCYTWDDFQLSDTGQDEVCGIEIPAAELDDLKIQYLKQYRKIFLILGSNNLNAFADIRSAIFRLMNGNFPVPVILRRSYHETDKEILQLKSSIDFGGLLIDGLGDGLWIENEGTLPNKELIETAFGILQASRVRMSKTEYISCPSCGRTQFDLQATTKKIRERTSHLKGLKIGIMGCIVNGPGEMADADYGYVGTGKGKVTLYKEKEIVTRNIPEEEAVDALIDLIKENGDWSEPEISH